MGHLPGTGGGTGVRLGPGGPAAPSAAAGPEGRSTPAPPTSGMLVAAVEDLQEHGPDLGWPEASSLADALIDTLSHLLVDLAAGAATPSPRPQVIGALGAGEGALDAASCRATAASLRRAGRLMTEAARPGGSSWAGAVGEVALDLADLLETTAAQGRAGRLAPMHKGPVLRRLHGLRRRLDAL